MARTVPSDLDEKAYDQALKQANALRIDISLRIDRLHLVTLPSALIEWMRGQGDSWPAKTRVGTVKEFGLGKSAEV